MTFSRTVNLEKALTRKFSAFLKSGTILNVDIVVLEDGRILFRTERLGNVSYFEDIDKWVSNVLPGDRIIGREFLESKAADIIAKKYYFPEQLEIMLTTERGCRQ